MKLKKISSTGSVNIPKDLRFDVGLHTGQGVKLEQDGENIIIKPIAKVCKFCGSTQNVKSVMGINICTDCGHKIHEAVMKND